MQKQVDIIHVGILIKVIDAGSIKGRSSADDAVDFIAFRQQEFREVRAVLSGDASDECFFQ